MSRFIVFLIVLTQVTCLPAFAAKGKKVAQKSATRQKTATQEEQPPISILSIIPAQGEPGMSVTLSGAGFTDKTIAFLGNVSMPTKLVSPKILTFDIPDLPPGLYALFVKREDGATSKPYNFMLQAQKPVAVSLSPDTLYSCATGKEREVVISGRNFQEGAQVLLDGAAIRSRVFSRESVSFNVPSQLFSGLHQVQVKNPSDEVSGAVALFIDTRPEILSVTQGGEYVNYYELVIEGKNFQQGSTLVVDGARLYSGMGPATERERFIYVDCTRIIYQRHPYDSTLKSIKIQVINPNSEESPVVTVNAP